MIRSGASPMHIADPGQPPRGVFAATVYPFQPMLMGAWPPEAAQIPPAAATHPQPEPAR